MIDKHSLDLVPPGTKPRVVLFLLGVALPLLITVAAALWDQAGSGAELAAGAEGSHHWLVVGGVMAFVVLLWTLLQLAMKRHRLELDRAQLRVATTFYTRTVPLSELLLDKARVIELEERPEFKPGLKSNGYALPGFQSGHFQLRNGDRAFVAIAGERRALWLPTASGKGLLLQPHQPDALLERLRELAQAQRRR